MQQINFYQAQFHPKTDWLNLQQAALLLILSLVVFATLGAWLETENSAVRQQLETQRALLEPLRLQTAELAKIAAQQSGVEQLDRQIAAIENEIGNKSRALNALKSSDIRNSGSFSQLLESLAYPKSNRIWFTEIKLAGEQLVLTGQTLDPVLITDWIEQATERRGLNRQFAAITIERNTNNLAVYDFVLSGGEVTQYE